MHSRKKGKKSIHVPPFIHLSLSLISVELILIPPGPSSSHEYSLTRINHRTSRVEILIVCMFVHNTERYDQWLNSNPVLSANYHRRRCTNEGYFFECTACHPCNPPPGEPQTGDVIIGFEYQLANIFPTNDQLPKIFRTNPLGIGHLNARRDPYNNCGLTPNCSHFSRTNPRMIVVDHTNEWTSPC